jgi:hypothetical protein
VFALVLVGGSFTELPIAHEALSRWVRALVVGIKTLKKVVAAEKELAQSLRVIKPEEISISPAAILLLGVDARGCCGGREEFREGLEVVSWQTRGGIFHRPCEMAVSPCSIVRPIRPRHLRLRGTYLWGKQWFP